MGLSNWASLVTDQYERAARLYPALLALFPMLVVLTTTSVFDKPLLTQVLSLSGTCGAAYLLSNISRMLGKAQETRLFDAWGGAPTTQLLRHRNEHIDPHTKQRYHAFLARKLKVEFPSSQDELASPEAADEVYRAGVKWLLGKTRDKKRFALLFKENVSYGFHRNCFGLRWVGGLVGVISVALLAVAFQAYNSKAWLELSSERILAIGIALFFLSVWAFFFNQTRVRQAACAYADMLLRACDELR